MAKHKMNIDHFFKIITSDSVKEKLKSIFEPLVTLAVQEAIKPLLINIVKIYYK